MYLSDLDIKEALSKGDITIDDFDPNRLQPASYDVLLGFDFLTFDQRKIEVMDPKLNIGKQMTKVTLKNEDDYFILHPNQFALGVTFDYFGCGNKYCCNLMGKSSLARLGLIIHTTAGFIDPGNTLNATLELFNVNSVPLKLYPKMKIAQIAFCKLQTPSAKSYGDKSLNSKYFKSTTVEASLMHKNFKSK